MKRARVGVAVAVTGLAAVLGISLLTPSGGANPALPTLVSDNPANYTPVLSGTGCYNSTLTETCRQVRDITRIGDQVWAGGVIDTVTDQTNGAVGTYGNAVSFNARTGAVRTDFRPRAISDQPPASDRRSPIADRVVVVLVLAHLA